MEGNSHLGIVCGIFNDTIIVIYDERGLLFMFERFGNVNKEDFNIGDIVVFNIFTSLGEEMPACKLFLLSNPNFSIKYSRYGSDYTIYGEYCMHHAENGLKEWRYSPFYTSNKESLLVKRFLKKDNYSELNNVLFERFYEDISEKISEIKLDDIFNSLNISIKEGHTKKIGGDDSYYVWKETSINTEDPYIRSLFVLGTQYLYSETAFVPWHVLKDESGYSDADFGICNEEIEGAIIDAKERYSYTEHHKVLLSMKLKDILTETNEINALNLQIRDFWPTNYFTKILLGQDDKTIEEFIKHYNSLIINKKIHTKYSHDVYTNLSRIPPKKSSRCMSELEDVIY